MGVTEGSTALVVLPVDNGEVSEPMVAVLLAELLLGTADDVSKGTPVAP
jgi:hypothetical protein